MVNSYNRKIVVYVSILLFLLSTILTGCRTKTAEIETSPESSLPTPTIASTLAPARVVLAAPAETPANELADAQTIIAELASGSGLEFEVRQEIFPNEITPDIKIIIFLEQPNNLGILAANAPDTQFVAISSQNWNPPENGTIIFKDEAHVAFISGYLSALLAPNFRVGALLTAENTSQNQAYINGVSYFCGICASVIYPLNTYPLISRQPANSPLSNWQAAFNEININKINVLFLPAEAASEELGIFLSGMDVAIIGEQTPSDALRSRWVATVSSDGLTPLREIWDSLLDGQGGKVLNANIKISDINYISLTDGLVWLSQGKMDLLEKVIALLREGQIYTGSIT